MLATIKAPKIPYPGAKGKMADSLVAMMPTQGRSYIEPCVGRGNVFFAAAAVLDFKHWRLNDTSTASFFEALLKTDGRIRVPPRTREVFDTQKRRFSGGHARAILLEPYLTFSGGGYIRGGFGGLRNPKSASYAATLQRCAVILKETGAEITALDWKKLDLDALSPDDFVFMDPPYLGADVRAYANDFDHAGMVEVLLNARFRWMLTEYTQPLYLKAFGQPRLRREVQLACDGIGRQRRVECVWTNY
jgi:site-specific DNA-adenine methylase